MSKKYSSLILCSINYNQSYFVEMIENGLLNQGFNTITIGKNFFAPIDKNYVIEAVNQSDVIVIIITNDIRINLINEIIEDNKTLFNIRKKPLMLFYEKNFYEALKDKGTYSVIINNSSAFIGLDLEEKIHVFIKNFKQIVEDQQLLTNLGKVGLVLGGIGIGLGLLFSIFKEED